MTEELKQKERPTLVADYIHMETGLIIPVAQVPQYQPWEMMSGRKGRTFTAYELKTAGDQMCTVLPSLDLSSMETAMPDEVTVLTVFGTAMLRRNSEPQMAGGLDSACQPTLGGQKRGEK